MATASLVTQSTDVKAQLKEIEGLLDKALSEDESGRIGEALTLYAQAETLISKLSSRRNGKVTDQEVQKRLDLYLANILSRKEALSEELETQLPSVPSAPPAYSERMESSQPARLEAVSNRQTAHQDILFSMSRSDAQLYLVSTEGRLSIPSYPAPLQLRQLTDTGTIFLQLGDWSCPLIPGETPVLLTVGENHSTLMLPDPQSLRPGDSVAIVLPRQLNPDEHVAFLRMLSQYTRLTVRDPTDNSMRPLAETDINVVVFSDSESETSRSDETSYASLPSEQRDTSDRVASGIRKTSDLIARGLQWGAEKGGGAIKRGSEALKSRLEKSEANDVSVNPRVRHGAKMARDGTHQVVTISGKAIDVLGSATKSVATWAAPHLRRQADKYLPKSLTEKSAPGSKSKADSAVQVASATLTGFATVLLALEEAAKVVGRATAEGTTNVVQTRYGNQAGQVTSNVLHSVGNVGMTVYTARQLAPKAVAIGLASKCVESADSSKNSDKSDASKKSK